VPGTMLKRAMMGRLPLMAFVGQVQQELADPIKIDRRVPDGPLGREKKKCDFAKRAIAYGASLGVQKYMQAISEKQELLGVLADCIILTFGMDSAIVRTQQIIAAKGEAASQVPLYMTQLFVAKAHEQVFDMLREMMMWMSQDEEWGREMRDINIPTGLDFSLAPPSARPEVETAKASAILIDATCKWEYPPTSLPRKEFMERAQGLWRELGLPELQLKNPWFGYNLGSWSEEDQADAERAIRGEHYATGEIRASQRVKLPKNESE